jgi:methyl-accepting chemotaxis protein
MSSSSSEIARRVAETASIARGAVRSSESTDSAMRGLSEAATRIGAIAGAIEQIAGRTNLLALNATIEAAHAGEAGRGFAVVASEVKQLAQQTARATAEIGSQISEIRAAAEGAIAAMAGVTAAIREVDEVAAAIAAAAEQQGAATREIAGNVGMVANATAQAAGSMRQVSHTALQTRGMSATVAEAAAGVTRQSDGLRAEVEHFLDAVRATASDRRRYERHPVANVAITLRVAGRTVTGKLQNVSLGGFRVAPALAEPPGTEVCVALPGATVDVAARIVGSDPTGTSLFFAQSEGAHHVVADVIARLVPESRAAA